jgi:hypothetical protein
MAEVRLAVPLRPFALVFAAALSLSACGSPNDPDVGGVTKAEAEQLNEAAEALNQNSPPPSVSDNNGQPAPKPAAK